MNSLKQQISATLSPSAEREMELICAQVLFQKSDSYNASMDNDTDEESDSEEIQEPMPDTYRSPKNQYHYSKLCVPPLQVSTTKPKHASKAIPIYKYTKLSTNTKDKRPSSHDAHASSTIVRHVSPYPYSFRRLCCDVYFCTQCISLLLISMLVTLCFAYCAGQIVNVTSTFNTSCAAPTIRAQTSYLSIYKDNNYITKPVSHDADTCWTDITDTSSSDHVYVSNMYTYTYGWKDADNITMEFIAFGFVGMYGTLILLYMISHIVMDLIHIQLHKIHTKSQLFINHRIRKVRSAKCVNKIQNNVSMFALLVAELCEFALQTQVLLLYNGYHILDPNGVYVAEEKVFIVWFAIVLCLHCFVSGTLWLSHALATAYVHGLIFKISVYGVDVVCGLFYVLFPLIVIVENGNRGKHIWISLGLLHTTIHSRLAYVALFLTLLLSFTRCLCAFKECMHRMRDNVYYQWKAAQCATAKLYPHNVRRRSMDREKDTSKEIGWFKRIVLLIISVCVIIYGLYVVSSVLSHFYLAERYCHALIDSDGDMSSEQVEELWKSNPELSLYDECLLKVYPFTGDTNRKCECRVFVTDWTELDSNVPQRSVVNGMVEHWKLLQVFRSCFGENEFANCTVRAYVKEQCDASCVPQYCASYGLSSEFMVQSVVWDEMNENQTYSTYHESEIYPCVSHNTLQNVTL